MESITLYFRDGSSDKVYSVSVEPKDGGYVVSFAYGRRGSTLSTGTKTPAPVDYPTAKGIYDKLVREKTAKGYTPGEDGTRYEHTDKASKATGIQCQLLNPVSEERVEDLIHDREHFRFHYWRSWSVERWNETSYVRLGKVGRNDVRKDREVAKTTHDTDGK